MSVEPINPADLGPASGFSHGQLGRQDGRVLFVAGQIGVVEGGAADQAPAMAEQFGEALRRVLRVVTEAGGIATDIGRMTVFVTDMNDYRQSRKDIGPLWKSHMGRHYPAMALVEVKSLVEPTALVEIEATAVIGGK